MIGSSSRAGFSGDEAAFAEMVAEWDRVCAVGRLQKTTVPPDWSASFADMKAEMNLLKLKGKWKAGPESVLSIINRGRRETFHCQMIAWLADPLMPHGLGNALGTERKRKRPSDPTWVSDAGASGFGFTRATVVVGNAEFSRKSMVLATSGLALSASHDCSQISSRVIA